MTIYHTHTVEETEQVGKDFAATLPGNCVVALQGTLGAGKTAFVRGMAEALAQGAEVSSPSYTILQTYLGRVPVYHFDLYRLNDLDDLESIGFYDVLERPGVKVIEWSERFPEELPRRRRVVSIEKIGEEEREISIDENFGA